MKIALMFAAALLVAPFAGTAHAQAYPTKPLRIIVPTAPGGGADVQGRLLAKKLSESFGLSVFVDNRPGASGIIGADVVAKSPPDGYTLLVTTAFLSTTPSLHAKLPYDPLKDFIPVTQIAFAPQVLITHPNVPAKTIKDFVALAKKQAGKLNAASSGSGSVNHLALEMLKQAAGINFVHIPYKSGAPAVASVIAGETDFSFTGTVTALPPIRAKQVRPIAVTSLKPTPALPDVAPIASLYPGFESANWYGLFAPAGTPAAIISRLHAESVKAINSPEMREFITREGAEPVASTPQEFAAHFRSEVERYAKIIKAAGVKVD
jgi:tripartite-type tricarboxylate transporter receptor subunit TctC